MISGNMNQKYIQPTLRYRGPTRSTNPFRYSKIINPMTAANTFNRVLGRLLKELSLLVGTADRLVIDQCCLLVEYFLKTGDIRSMGSLMDLMDLMEVLLTVCHSHDLWLRVRAIYLTLQQSKRLKPAIKEELIILKARQSSE